jgi:hypothetical protein
MDSIALLEEIICGFICGFIYTIFMYKKKVGSIPRLGYTIYPFFYKGMLQIPINNKALHIHHWIISFFISIFAFFMNYIFLLGFSLILCIHGLTYADRFCIIIKNNYK